MFGMGLVVTRSISFLDRRTGGIMVCCKCSNKIILLNTKLTEIYPNLVSTSEIKRCSVIAFDEELRNLFVADAETRKIVFDKDVLVQLTHEVNRCSQNRTVWRKIRNNASTI